jgi:hypothetical protein
VEELLARLEASKKAQDLQRLADAAVLREELWEIKPGDVRLTFYELTDGLHSVRVTRLTTGFIKRQRRAPRREIDRGLWVIREDKQT